MPRRVGFVIVVLMLTSAGMSIRGYSQLPSGRTSSGTGRIAGLIVDANTGNAVAGALVSLEVPLQGGAFQSSFIPRPLRVKSDTQGRFVFQDLPEGEYSRLAAEAPGYLGGSYGQVEPLGPSRVLELSGTNSTRAVTIRLWRTASIAGLVTDELGRPMPQVGVVALMRTPVAGHRRLAVRAVSRTNKKGEYKVTGLAPGEYVVLLPSTQVTIPVDGLSNPWGLSRDLSRWLSALPNSGPLGQARIGNNTLHVFGQPLPGPSGDRGVRIYAPVFWPGAEAPSGAVAIPVGAGEERSAIDLQVKATPTTRVSGQLIGVERTERLSIELVPVAAAEFVATTEFQTTATVAEPDGSFAFLGVIPGQYRLRVWNEPPAHRQPSGLLVGSKTDGVSSLVTLDPATGVATPVPISSGRARWAEVPLSVGETDVSGVVVEVRSAFRLAGRLQFDGTTPIPPPVVVRQVAIGIEAAEGPTRGVAGAAGRGVVDEDGTFVTTTVPPGRYFVRAGGIPRGWAIRSVMFGQVDVSNVALAINGDVKNLVMVLTDRPSRISGTVLDDRGRPVPNAAVAAFPTDTQMWADYGLNPRRLRLVSASDAGTYVLNGLPPGPYYLSTARLENLKAWPDPQLLTALAKSAVRTSVGDGTSGVLNLRLGLVADPGTAESDPAGPAGGPSGPEDGTLQAADTQRSLLAPTPGGVLSGQVVSRQQPAQAIAGALVLLSSPSLPDKREVRSDDRGAFTFVDVPAGRFSIVASKPGYLSAEYGEKQPNEGLGGVAIELASGQRHSLTIAMWPAATLSGKIAESDGGPSPKATVRLIRCARNRLGTLDPAGWSVGPGSDTTTDDHGSFSFLGVAPGQYVLVAVAARSRLHVPVGHMVSAARQEDSGMNHVPTYYPSTADARDATVLDLKVGEDRTDAFLRLVSSPLRQVSGTLVGPSAESASRVQITVRPIAPAPLQSLLPSQVVTTDFTGNFSVANWLTPGRYALLVPGISLTELNSGRRGSGRSTLRLCARLEIEVGVQDLSDVVVNLVPTANVSGRVVVGDLGASSSSADAFSVRLIPISRSGDLSVVAAPSTKTGPNGVFDLTGIPPGRYRFSVTTTRADRADNAAMTLRSVTVGDRDALQDGVEVRPGDDLSGALVTAIGAASEVAGVLENADGNPADYYVVVFPSDRSHWQQESSFRQRAVRPSTSWRYSVIDLAPGDYVLAVTTLFDSEMWLRTGVLEGLKASGIHLSLGVGERLTQDIRVTR